MYEFHEVMAAILEIFVNCPVANMTHLVFLYKGFFPTVSKSLFSADSKSDCSQTQKVERFSKNR